MTTRVDFYQLSRDPVELTVAKLAHKALQAGERLLVVASDEQRRAAIGEALWAQGGAAFLAHGNGGDAHADRQPILISASCEAENGARLAILADGSWREEAIGFDRVMLLFDPAGRDAARDLWRRFASDEAIDNRIFKQTDSGGWREGA